MLIVKYNVDLKSLLQQGISEQVFYSDFVYKFKGFVGIPDPSVQFKLVIKCYKLIYNMDILRQSVCLVNPITVYSYFFIFNYMRLVRPQIHDSESFNQLLVFGWAQTWLNLRFSYARIICEP